MTAVSLAQALRADSLDAEHPDEDPAFEEAFRILQSALARNPHSAELLVCLAQSQVALGRPDDAIASLRRAVDSDPTHPLHKTSLAASRLGVAASSIRTGRQPARTGEDTVQRHHRNALAGAYSKNLASGLAHRRPFHSSRRPQA